MDPLADLFVHPDSGNLIADTVERGVEPVLLNAARRQRLQMSSIAAAFDAPILNSGALQ